MGSVDGILHALAYEKQWYDLDNASADFDQFKLGFVMRY